jgi:hypothetical protein
MKCVLPFANITYCRYVLYTVYDLAGKTNDWQEVVFICSYDLYCLLMKGAKAGCNDLISGSCYVRGNMSNTKTMKHFSVTGNALTNFFLQIVSNR